MNADQIIEGIGKAVLSTKPTQEYCVLWIDTWATCLTKGEWSGWVQAIGSILAIAAAAIGLKWQMREGQRLQLEKENRDNKRDRNIKYKVLAFRALEIKVWATSVKNLGTHRQQLWSFLREDCKERLNIINSISANDFPDPKDIQYIALLQKRLVAIKHILEETPAEADALSSESLDEMLIKLIFDANEAKVTYHSAESALDI